MVDSSLFHILHQTIQATSTTPVRWIVSRGRKGLFGHWSGGQKGGPEMLEKSVDLSVEYRGFNTRKLW